MSKFNVTKRLEALAEYLDGKGYPAGVNDNREVVVADDEESMVFIELAGEGFNICNSWLPFRPNGDFPYVEWDTASRYVAKVSDIEGVLWRALGGYHD
jgi:hypothetical protein